MQGVIRVDQGDPAPVFPGFTVIQLNRYKEHPRGYELSLENEGSRVPSDRDHHFSLENISHHFCNGCLPI